jgi:hypothetical protein
MQKIDDRGNPDVILHIPQAQFRTVQTRLTDHLLQSQYAFLQSFSAGLDTIFTIFFDTTSASTPEQVRLILCPTTQDVSVTMIRDQTRAASSQSLHTTNLLEQLVAICTAHEGR